MRREIRPRPPQSSEGMNLPCLISSADHSGSRVPSQAIGGEAIWEPSPFGHRTSGRSMSPATLILRKAGFPGDYGGFMDSIAFLPWAWVSWGISPHPVREPSSGCLESRLRRSSWAHTSVQIRGSGPGRPRHDRRRLARDGVSLLSESMPRSSSATGAGLQNRCSRSRSFSWNRTTNRLPVDGATIPCAPPRTNHDLSAGHVRRGRSRAPRLPCTDSSDGLERVPRGPR